MAFNRKLWITVALFWPCVIAQTTVSDPEWENFKLVNKLRADGFSCTDETTFAPNSQPLVFDCALWKAAHLHSKDMKNKNYFSHMSKDGKSPWDRAPTAYAENIAQGSKTAQSALHQWKKSNEHCKNMGNPAWKSFGVGEYQTYWTQMFGYSAGTDKSCYPSATTTTTTAASTAAPVTTVTTLSLASTTNTGTMVTTIAGTPAATTAPANIFQFFFRLSDVLGADILIAQKIKAAVAIAKAIAESLEIDLSRISVTHLWPSTGRRLRVGRHLKDAVVGVAVDIKNDKGDLTAQKAQAAQKSLGTSINKQLKSANIPVTVGKLEKGVAPPADDAPISATGASVTTTTPGVTQTATPVAVKTDSRDTLEAKSAPSSFGMIAVGLFASCVVIGFLIRVVRRKVRETYGIVGPSSPEEDLLVE